MEYIFIFITIKNAGHVSQQTRINLKIINLILL